MKLRRCPQEWFSHRRRSPLAMAPQGFGVKVGGGLMRPFGEFNGIARQPEPPVADYESVKTKFRKSCCLWFYSGFWLCLQPPHNKKKQVLKQKCFNILIICKAFYWASYDPGKDKTSPIFMMRATTEHYFNYSFLMMSKTFWNAKVIALFCLTV